MARPVSLVLAALLAAGPASAQTIYPLNRADILTGAKFDFKVEFPGAPAEADTKITIAGQTPAAYFGKDGTFIRNEVGLDHSAFVIRDVAIKAPGAVAVEASAGASTARVTWGAYATPAPRRARNVILFIGDGLTIAHRTAARIVMGGYTQGKATTKLAMDSFPNTAMIMTASLDTIITDSAPAAKAFARSPENLMPPSAMTGTSAFSATE
jgi:alkaline phosphatase